MNSSFQLIRTQVVRSPLGVVAAFFEEPRNLEKITPDFLNFRILTPGKIEMKNGALIDYTISLYGIPMRWRTQIEDYRPGQSFVDRQLKGPYKLWHHLHTFREVEGGTEIGDELHYELPMGPLGKLVHSFIVQKQLTKIFEFRRLFVEQYFNDVENLR